MLIVSMNQRWNWKAWTLQTSWHLSLDSLEVAPPPPPAWAPYHQIRHQFCPFRLWWQTSIQPQSQWIPAARSWISWQSLKFLVSCRVSFNIYIHELKKQIKNFFYQTTNYKLVTYFYCQLSVLQATNYYWWVSVCTNWNFAWAVIYLAWTCPTGKGIWMCTVTPLELLIVALACDI